MGNELKPQNSSGTWILTAISALIISGILVIFVYAIAKSSSACGSCEEFQIFAVSVGISLAALVVGGLLGFLFSIPRSGAQDKNAPYHDNSNLVDISDWLTKVLVGASLVTLSKIPPKLHSLADWIGQDGLGDKKDGAVFALALMIFFTVCGFLWMYVWTQLYFWRALMDSRGGTDLLNAIKESKADLKATMQTDLLYAIKESPVANLLLRALSLPRGSQEPESKALLNQAKFMGKTELLEHPESRKIAIQYSRLLDEQFNEREEAIRVLKETLLTRRKKAIPFDDDDAALNFNIACYLNRKAKEEANQMKKEGLRSEATNLLREAAQHDANIKAEANADPDLADLPI